MSLADQLGVLDPNDLMTDAVGQTQPDLASQGVVEPSVYLDRLIRKGVGADGRVRLPAGVTPAGRAKQAPAQQPDFTQYGKSADDLANEPQVDLTQFGEEAPAEKAKNTSFGPWVAAKEAAQGAVSGTGAMLQGASVAGGTHKLSDDLQAFSEGVAPVNIPEDQDVTISPQDRVGYKAGAAVKKFAQENIPVSDAEREAHPYWSEFGKAAGGGAAMMGAALGGAALGGPIAGIGAGMAAAGLQGAGDTFEAAKAKGASDDDALHAAGISGAVNGAMMGLPIGMVLTPIKAFGPGLSGWALGKLAQFGANGGVFTAVGEAQHWVDTQIAHAYYDPDAKYDPSLKRAMGEFLAGGMFGVLHPLRGTEQAQQQAAGAQPEAEAATDAKAQPGAGLPPPNTGEAGAQPGTGAGPQPGPQPGTGGAGSAAEPPRPRGAQWADTWAQTAAPGADEQTGKRWQTLAKMMQGQYGFAEADLKNASFADLARFMAAADALQANGVSRADIRTMTPADMAEAMGKMREQTGSQAEEDKGEPGTRANPINLNTAADVQRAAAMADAEHTHAQGEANNVRRGHAVWNGMPVVFEVAAGGTRRGTVPGSGAPWETTHPNAYGYFSGLKKAADGGDPDVVFGNHPNAASVFVIDEIDPKTGKYRQSKSFAGFLTPNDAAQAYAGISSKSFAGIGGMRAFGRDEFVELAKDGGLSKPVTDLKARAEQPKAAEPQQKPAMAADQPTAEPVSDILAQARDLADQKNRRAAVWLPASSVEHLASQGKLDTVIGSNPALHDFDGRGGILVARDLKTARIAKEAKASGRSVQEIVGRLTGAGTGKPADGTHVVQQIDAQGNVTREGLVRENEVKKTYQAFSQPGRTVQVVTPEDALTRRAARVAQEAGPEQGRPVSHDDHHAVAEALRQAGIDPGTVRPADIARAGEIAAHDGIGPDEAFPIAVVQGLVHDGHITPEQLKEVVGNESAEAILESGGGNIVGGGTRAPASGPAAGGPVTEAAGDVAAGRAENGEGETGQHAQAGADHGAAGAEADGRVGGVSDTGDQEAGRNDVHPAGGERNAEPTGSAGEIGQRTGQQSADERETAAATKTVRRHNKPLSLLEYIGKSGGLKPNPELTQMGMDFRSRIVVPVQGYRSLIRRNGMSMDELVENLREAGYLEQAHAGRPDDSGLRNEVLNLIDEELRGKKQYPIGSEAPQARQDDQQAEHDARIEQQREKLHAALDTAGMPLHSVTTDLEERAIRLMLDNEDNNQHSDPLDVLEAAATSLERDRDMMADADYADAGVGKEVIHALDEIAAPQDREEAPRESAGIGNEGSGAGARAGEVSPGGGIGAGQEPEAGTSERTEAGEQTVIPGTERISEAELAKRKAKEGLKPKVAQEKADEGLFSDESQQTDLVDIARKPKAEAKAEPGPTKINGIELDEEGRPTDQIDQALLDLDRSKPVKSPVLRKALIEGELAQGAKLRLTDAGKERVKKVLDAIEEFDADPVEKALIEAGLVSNGDSGRSIVNKNPKIKGSRLFRFVASYTGEKGNPSIALSHPKLADDDAVKAAEKIAGVKAKYDDDDHAQWYHAVDLATDEGWKDLVKTRDYTDDDKIARGVEVNLGVKGRLSLDSAKKLLAQIGMPDPGKAKAEEALLDHARVHKEARGWIVNYGGAKEGGDPAWGMIYALQGGTLKYDRSGHLTATDDGAKKIIDAQEERELPGNGTLANRIAWMMMPDAEWTTPQWRKLIGKSSPDTALHALRKAAEGELSYEQAARAADMAKTVADVAKGNAGTAESGVKEKGKKKADAVEKARAPFEQTIARAKKLEGDMVAVQAKHVEAALEERRLKTGDAIKVKGEFYDGRTGAKSSMLYGTINYQKGQPSVNVVVHPGGDWAFLNPDDIKNRVVLASKEEMEKRKTQPTWQFTYDMGEEGEVDKQYLADRLNDVASGDAEIGVVDDNHGTHITIDGQSVGVGYRLGDLTHEEIARSFLRAAQEEAGFDDSDRVHIEQAVDEQIEAQRETGKQAKAAEEKERDAILQGMKDVDAGRAIDDEARELLREKDLIRGKGEKLKLSSKGATRLKAEVEAERKRLAKQAVLDELAEKYPGPAYEAGHNVIGSEPFGLSKEAWASHYRESMQGASPWHDAYYGERARQAEADERQDADKALEIANKAAPEEAEEQKPPETASAPSGAFPPSAVGTGTVEEAKAPETGLSDSEGETGRDSGEPVAAMAMPTKAPTFYSAVERTITNAKQEKAAPNQWLGMLRNAPGVKAEELQWLGLEDWLREHKGPVTKTDLGDYIRANQIEVKEVERGGAGNLSENLDDWEQSEPTAADEATDESSTWLTLPGQQDGDTGIMAVHDSFGEALRYETWVRGERLANEREFGTAARALADQIKAGATPTKYASYQLPGGENYRELLLTLPPKLPPGAVTVGNGRAFDADNREIDVPAQYRSAHWDEPNVIAHIRFNDRTMTADGTSYTPPRRTLFIEEVQSDWHQKGRKQGYRKSLPSGFETEIENARNVLIAALEKDDNLGFDDVQLARAAIMEHASDYAQRWEMSPETKAAAERYLPLMLQKRVAKESVPDAPFKTTWPELALKRMIRYAAEHGYDQLAWAPGDVQAARYDLSKQIDSVQYYPRTEKLIAIKHGEPVINKKVPQDELADAVGKDVAERLLNTPTKLGTGDVPYHGLSGLDLKVGGEGMQAFYDRELPNKVNALVKKFGAKVERKRLSAPQPDQRYWVRPIREDRTQRILEWQVHDLLSDEKEPIATFAADEQARADALVKELREKLSVDTPVHVLPITDALREAALNQGFPLFQARPAVQPSRGLTEAAEAARLQEAARRRVLRPAVQARRAQIEAQIQRVIEHIMGPGKLRVSFADTIPAPHGEQMGWGDNMLPTLAGSYAPMSDLLRVAMADPNYADPASAAFHEAWHGVEDHLLDDREMSLLNRELPRLRDYAKRLYGMTDEQAAQLADYEVRAIGFQGYAAERAQGGMGRGLHIGVRAIFEKLMRLFRAIMNALRGLGFRTYEDLFSDAYEGKLTERESRKAEDGSRLANEIVAQQEREAASRRPTETEGEGPVAAMAGWPRMKRPIPPGLHPSFIRSELLRSAAGVAKSFKRFWTSTFQPELFSDRALEADPLFARYKAAQAHEKDAIIRQSENEWNYWNQKPDSERIAFIDAMERGTPLADKTQADMARRYRRMLDANWAEEQKWGSKAGFVQDYFPHIWESPDEWRAFAEARSAQVGPTWFQKSRTFEYIEEGLAAGLKLKYTNPIDIIVHRLLSGVDMRQRMQLLHSLKDMGLAWEGSQGGDQLVRRGWRAINAPDRKQWVVAPDAQLLWKNGVEAKGLWQDEHVGGSIFRGWMTIKNAWVPIKLAMSAFHPLHVLHINYSNGMARAWDDVVKGKDPAAAIKSVGEGFFGPMRAAPGASTGAAVGALLGSVTPVGPVWGGLAGSIAGAATYGRLARKGTVNVPHPGKTARTAWVKRPSQQTAEEKAIVALMTDGGFVPQIAEQMKISAKRKLAEAFEKIKRGEAGVPEWRKFVSAAMRRPIEALQAPIFEQWIPNLKTAAYLQEAAALFKRNPDLLTNDDERRLALRAIGQQIDSRFGEKFYGSMFWNRYVKDASIASFLSLGWNYGFVHQFGGAALEAVTRPAGFFKPLEPNAPRKRIRSSTNKIAFALAYIASAALINGIMTALFTGDMPTGNDWIFARIGGTNPDGSPRRVTNMFYLRELPMLLKHVQERGGNWLSGMGEMMWNKLMFQPFHELATNRDYYGYNIWDENAPFYKQAWQALKYELGEQANPITISGAKHAADLSGHPFPSKSEALSNPGKAGAALGAKGVDLSMLGFGPAPAYVEKTPLQNRISYLYSQHVAPVSRPEEEGENSREKMAVRSAIMAAKQGKDSTALQEAYARGRAIGLSQTYMGKVGVTPTDMYLFSRLPAADQKSVLQQASPDEYRRYFPRAHTAVKMEINRIHTQQ